MPSIEIPFPSKSYTNEYPYIGLFNCANTTMMSVPLLNSKINPETISSQFIQCPPFRILYLNPLCLLHYIVCRTLYALQSILCIAHYVNKFILCILRYGCMGKRKCSFFRIIWQANRLPVIIPINTHILSISLYALNKTTCL